MTTPRLSDTPRVDETAAAWALANTPLPLRVKEMTKLARRLERDLRQASNLWAAYQRVNAKHGCPDGACGPVLPVNGVRIYPDPRPGYGGDWP